MHQLSETSDGSNYEVSGSHYLDIAQSICFFLFTKHEKDRLLGNCKSNKYVIRKETHNGVITADALAIISRRHNSKVDNIMDIELDKAA